MPTQRMDQLTPASPREVFEAMKRSRVDAGELELGPLTDNALMVLVAQWGLETGIGHAMHCYNLGNLKGRPDGSDGCDWTFFRCSERLPVRGPTGGVVIDPATGKPKMEIRWFDPPDPTACFRAYGSLDDGVRDYLQRLRSKYDRAWPSALSGDPATFAHELKAQRYYTASEASYTKTLVALFHEFEASILGLEDLHTTKGVQEALNRHGASPRLTVDGLLGADTKAAIRAFQHDQGLVVDGVVGPETMRELAR